MRTFAFALAFVLVAGSAGAQQPIAPAVEQADDAEIPRPERLLPPPSTEPATPARTHASDVLLPPPGGWQYRLVDGPPVEKRRWGLFTGGMVTFSAVWLANLQAGIPTGQVFLDVPLIGPLLEITSLRFGEDSSDARLNGWLTFLLVTDAAAQIGGFAMMIAGATTTTKKPGVQRVELVPLGAGAAIRGTF
jgi:hypothetical protein